MAGVYIGIVLVGSLSKVQRTAQPKAVVEERQGESVEEKEKEREQRFVFVYMAGLMRPYAAAVATGGHNKVTPCPGCECDDARDQTFTPIDLISSYRGSRHSHTSHMNCLALSTLTQM